MLASLFIASAVCFQPAEPLREVVVTADDTVIDASCRVVIPPDTVIADENGDGVIHIGADGIEVRFAPGSALRGAAADTPCDQLAGVGVRLRGHSGVTLSGLRVHGYKAGVWATGAEELTLEDADLSDNFRQRLLSTAAAEDAADWLSPHANDGNEWLARYGAALYVEDSRGVTVRNVRVRRGQNGIILDNVSRSRIYDNDASFLSGWGLAMWRSSDNIVSRNAFDFCVRGHVEGVYNRGQDSAGILMFEQCSRNVIAENSATHSGDGLFSFAGLEAIGERPAAGDIDYADAGCNDNLIIENDFSYAPAHGIEITFSEGNSVIRNVVVGNAICGLWGGYSSDTLIAQNLFERNGGMAYGLERGGVNIEHGAASLIVDNTFVNNLAGVHLWWDDDGRVLELPGVSASGSDVVGNVIAGNTFVLDPRLENTFGAEAQAIGLHFRSPAAEKFEANRIDGNEWRLTLDGAQRHAFEPGTEPDEGGGVPAFQIPPHEVLGQSRPVGARAQFAELGRRHIILDEWGPWDHRSPLVRTRSRTSNSHEYEVFGAGEVRVKYETGPAKVTVLPPEQPASPLSPLTVRVHTDRPGVHPYSVALQGSALDRSLSGVLVNAAWDVRVWSWQSDPLAEPDAWRAESQAIKPVRVEALAFGYGWGGPADFEALAGEAEAGDAPGADRFGMIATSTIPLPAGRWRVTTRSDDGVRVLADGETLIERWDIHGPTVDTAVLTLDELAEVAFTVEHFENDGYAVLEFSIEPAR